MSGWYQSCIYWENMEITLKNITKKYGSTVALSQFSCTFSDGELSSLLGPSGCGKSTLLQLVSGILQPDEGEILMDGVPIDEACFEDIKIGYVFQDFSLYPDMKVFDNIAFPLTNQRKHGCSRKERKAQIAARVTEIARLLRIEELLGRYPRELSGGQQQRVAIGRALVKEPDILLMDEPFANLDKKLANDLRDEIREIQKKLRITTIFVTHNQGDAIAVSDRIFLMESGHLMQEGTADDLYTAPANLFVADFISQFGINLIRRDEAEQYGLSKVKELFAKEKNCFFVALRPEQLMLEPAENGGEGYTVLSSAYNGLFAVHTLQKEAVRLCAVGLMPFSPGEKVTVLVKNKMFGFTENGNKINS